MLAQKILKLLVKQNMQTIYVSMGFANVGGKMAQKFLFWMNMWPWCGNHFGCCAMKKMLLT